MRVTMALAAASLMTTMAAQAITITTSGGSTTAFTRVGGGTIPTETFDNVDAGGIPADHIADPNCGLDTYSPIGPRYIEGDYTVDTASVHFVRRNPNGAGSTSCYLSIGGQGETQTGSTRAQIDLGSFTGPNNGSGYVGFYMGSVDSYNYVSFYQSNEVGNGLGSIIPLPGSPNGILTGTQIAAMGNFAVDAGINTYINFQFAASDGANYLVLGNTSDNSLEIDNLSLLDSQPMQPLVVVRHGLAAVPEPGAALALGTGLGLLGLARRKRA